MTHFKIDIQLPLTFNPEDGGRKIPEELYFQTYEDLLKLARGISSNNTPVLGSWICPETKSSNNTPVLGSWICPETKARYNDTSITFTVLVESEDKVTITNASKIKELIKYKKTLIERFKQKKIFMVATRCSWI